MRALHIFAFSSLIQLGSIAALPALWAETGKAELRPTSDTSTAYGTVRLSETDAGLDVEAQLSGVSPGKHGFHIHEFGDCSEAGAAAGGHYNPSAHPHGDAVHGTPGSAHVGDLGNVEISPDGTGSLRATLKGVSLSGEENPVAGRAFILHEKEDDFGQPTGNAGGRIACGEIVLTKE